MVIVEVINSLHYRGGGQTLMASLSKELNSRENVSIIVISLFSDIDDSFISYFKEHNIRFFSCFKKKGFDRKCISIYKKLILDINPDVIHMHLSVLPTHFFAFGTRKRKWKIFETIHSIPGSTIGMVGKIIRDLYISAKNIHLIAISDIIYDMTKSKYRNANISCVYNGVELRYFSNNFQAEKLYDFIIVASMKPVKNHALLFEAFSKWILRHPSSKLICVGGGELLNDYKKLICEKNLDKNIIFTGEVSNPFFFLQQSKVFVLTSTREGNPMSIIEAMNCGLPIVATRVGGIPDVVKEGHNGFLFESNNCDQLLKCFEKATALFKSIGEYNQEYCKKFDIIKCADDYLKIFGDKNE